MKPLVLVADDEENLRRTIVERLERHGAVALAASDGAEALEIVRAREVAVALVDVRMPRLGGMDLLDRIREESPETQVVVMTGCGSIEGAVEAMRRGALDYLAKPLRLAELDVVIEKAARIGRAARVSERLGSAAARTVAAEGLVGESPEMGEVRRWIARAASTDRPVLVIGETGTGKELVARAIHVASARATGAFVAINCGSFRKELLESELLGHERGAFTGAVGRKAGLVEIAAGGTLFLDEVGEMPPEAQVMLLRTLEDGRFRRIGGTREQMADFRVVAATNRNLKHDAETGRFREDLYYRLAVVEFAVPPLRDRRGDIPDLVRRFRDTAAAGGRSVEFSEEAIEALAAHRWPGNVRELRNIVERLSLLAEAGRVEADLVDEILGAGVRLGAAGLPTAEACRASVEAHGGNKTAAAKTLGISRPTLYRLLKTVSGPASL